jgi:hypothetical protein
MLKEIEELLNREPFQPFRVTLTSGQSYEVRVPQMVVLEKDVIYFYHPRSDLKSILRLNQLAALDMIE